MSFEEEFKNMFMEVEDFNMDGINNFRDFVDYCVITESKTRSRYVYKQRVKEAIEKITNTNGLQAQDHTTMLRNQIKVSIRNNLLKELNLKWFVNGLMRMIYQHILNIKVKWSKDEKGTIYCNIGCKCGATKVLIKVQQAVNKTLRGIKLSELV